MKRIIILIVACSLMAFRYNAVAQSVKGMDQVLDEMKALQSFYNNQALSFSMKYTYAAERDPGTTLDSLSGLVEIAGANCRYSMDSTEVIRNKQYTIILFKEDRLMYLTRPDTMMAATDPLGQMKQAMERAGVDSGEVLRAGGYKTLRVFFRKDAPYRQMEITIDANSGYMLKSTYIMKTALLMDGVSGEEAAREGYDEYAIVQVSFEHYRKTKLNPARFSEHSFFYKEGDDFKTTAAYSDYQLFIGTPNL